jgi:methylphosphotriester-DNA--protein-cysteine methyltransferase
VTVPRPLHDPDATNLEHPLHAMQQSFVDLVDTHDGNPELDQHEVKEVGYESEAAFNRAFKREFGMAPGGWGMQRIEY